MQPFFDDFDDALEYEVGYELDEEELPHETTPLCDITTGAGPLINPDHKCINQPDHAGQHHCLCGYNW